MNGAEDIARCLPQAPEIEKSVLGVLAHFPQERMPEATEKILPDHFYHPGNRRLFELFCETFEAGEPIELIALTDRLDAMGELDKIGGPGYLTEIFTAEPPAANFHYYTRVLNEKFLLRAIIHTGHDLVSLGYDATEGGAELVAKLVEATEESLFSLSTQAGRCQPKRTVRDAVADVLEEMRNRREQPDKTRIRSTGFEELDAKIGGLIPPDLIVIGGPSGQGKTALLLAILEQVAVRSGDPVAIFSMEMSDRDLVKRWFARLAHVRMTMLRSGTPSEAELEKLREAGATLAAAPIHIRDTSDLKLPELRAECRLLRGRYNVEVFGVDYVQLIRNESRFSRERAVAEVSAALKAIAKELDAVVIALSQLNEDGKIRESRAVYHDADVVLLIKELGLKVDKQRNGPAGDTVDIDFEPDYAAWIAPQNPLL